MSSKKAVKSNYKDVVKAFKEAGFIDIKTEADYDITLEWLAEDGDVESISIGDTSKFKENDTFSFNETVRITYHTLKKNKPKK